MRRALVVLVAILALGAGATATEIIQRGVVISDVSAPTLPTLQLRRGAFTDGPIANMLDIGFRDDNTGAMPSRNGLDVRGYADPLVDTDAKWQAAEFQISVPDGNVARMTRNIASAIFRATYFGNGWLDSMYGMHILSLIQRGSGSVDYIYGTYTNVGTTGSATGHLKSAAAHYVPDCLRAAGSIIDQCIGIWIKPQTGGTLNWNIFSEGGKNQFNGPVLLLLDGGVKQVQQGEPDSCGVGKRCLIVEN